MKFDGLLSSESGNSPPLLGIPREKTLTVTGVLSVRDGVATWKPPTKIEISSVRYSTAIASSGDVISWSLKKNGVSIATGILSEGQYGGITDTLSDITGDVGDRYYLDITSVGSITAGAHLYVQINYNTVD